MSGQNTIDASVFFFMIAKQLVGQRLRSVVYYETKRDPTDEGHWNEFGSAFDSLDIGLDMEIQDGHRFSLSWGRSRDWELYIADHSLASELVNYIATDVSSAPRWIALIGKEIRKVSLFTKQYEGSSPQHLLIEFASGDSVVFSSAKYMPGSDQVIEFADHVLATFSKETMLKYSIGAYSEFVSFKESSPK